MSILNVNQIQPVGSGQTVTISAANITASSSTITASSITATSGTLTGISSVSTTNLTVNGNAIASTGPLSNRNIIINGDMKVAQRGTQVTSVTSTGYRTCDRFNFVLSSLGTWTVDQDTNAPNGFSNSFKVTCTTADASPAASDLLWIAYRIEGFDCQRLLSAANTTHPMRLSFWVRSNRTGNASIEFFQSDNSGRQFTTSYNIAAADTWEHKVVEIPVDTAAVFNNDNGSALNLNWWLNSGSNYTGGSHNASWTAQSNSDRNATNLGVGGATSDYFAITGVQLEVGTVATPFEHRSYGDELARCQRYYQVINAFGAVIAVSNTTSVRFGVRLNPEMRDTPSVSLSQVLKINSPGVTEYSQSSADVGLTGQSGASTNKGILLNCNNFTGLTSQQVYLAPWDNTKLYASAEL